MKWCNAPCSAACLSHKAAPRSLPSPRSMRLAGGSKLLSESRATGHWGGPGSAKRDRAGFPSDSWRSSGKIKGSPSHPQLQHPHGAHPSRCPGPLPVPSNPQMPSLTVSATSPPEPSVHTRLIHKALTTTTSLLRNRCNVTQTRCHEVVT